MSFRKLLSVCSLLLIGLAVPSGAKTKARFKQQPASEVTAIALTTPVLVQQGDVKLEELERIAAQQANVERQKAGLSPLSYSSELSDVARAHSQEMQERKYFGHDSPTSGLRTALDRYRAAYKEAPAVVAENLYGAWGGNSRQLGDSDIVHAHTSLMHSPTHRANILFPNLTHIGVGIVTNAAGDIWLTEMFIFAKQSPAGQSNSESLKEVKNSTSN